MPYPLPSEHERRTLFAYLKQATSLTAWRRLYAYHQAFVDIVGEVYEEEQKGGAPRVTIPTDWLTDLLRDHDAFAGALERLARGDRRCFTFLGMRGHFSQGLLSVQWWQDMWGGWLYGRNGFDVADSPRWPEIGGAMHRCMLALSDIGVVLQKQHTDVPAPIYSMEDHLTPLGGHSLLKHLAAQPTHLPVSIAEPEVLVRTGRTVPFYGIWEPVQVAAQTGLLGVFRGPAPAPAGGRQLDGCMNYLHADSDAPTIAFPEDNQRREGRATTWRLLWKDERYGPNPIPAEEADYVFVRPFPGEDEFKAPSP